MDTFEWTEQTPVTANNMNEMQNILNDNISEAMIDEYSTTEKVIGIWMGKTLYRKTIFLSSLPSTSGTTTYNHNISNPDEIWFDVGHCFAIWNYGANGQFTNCLPFFNSSGNHIYLANLSKTSFDLITNMDRHNLRGYITIEYTKMID